MKNLKTFNNINSTELNSKQVFENDMFSVIEKRYSLSDIGEGVCDKVEIERVINNEDIKERGLDFGDVLRLAGYFGEIKKITKLDIENNVEGIYKIKIESDDFDNLETHIEIPNNVIKINWMKINKFMANNGVGKKCVVNLIYFAKEKGFQEIYTVAAKIMGLDKKYKNKGYHFFPKIGFLVSENDNEKPEIMKKIRKNPEFFDMNNINELLLNEDEKGNRMGLEIWKKIGDSVLVEFDLSDDSKSMKILRKYLKK